MIINYTIRGSISVPDGSTLHSDISAIVLPDGEMLKLWEQWEGHHDEEIYDLSYSDMVDRDCFYAGLTTAEFDEVEQ